MHNYDPLQFVFPHGPAPLPANAPQNFAPQQHTAYAVAQAVESLSQWSPVTVSTGSMTPQMAGRLLGYMLLEAPTAEGRDNVTFEIASCSGDETRLKQLAQLYAKVYIQTFKANDGRTLNDMDESSDSSDDEDYTPPSSMEETHWETKQNASKRDRRQCILSRYYDVQYMDDLNYFEPKHPLLSVSDPFGFVREARIIPKRQTDISDGKKQGKHEYSTRASNILSRFGKTDIFEELNVDDLSNMMTLNSSIHESFDALYMCLTAIEGRPNAYKIEAFHSGALYMIPENPVTFTTPDEKSLPLPSPALLALHRACVRVAHLSGAGSYVHDLLDMDDTGSDATEPTCVHPVTGFLQGLSLNSVPHTNG
ncbi:hypothetical protein ARMSODRAFT_1078079 [Armillaria solidipes]|uniref:HNH nuclease domain-containing protein n=1 Tax=Armillaria solidipes TaxID=1076256 RepID=A0A2H3C636_9AGAR|nr:hypothetical protein ARMSODRAFT_1078079 [Armillaria solidipes]